MTVNQSDDRAPVTLELATGHSVSYTRERGAGRVFRAVKSEDWQVLMRRCIVAHHFMRPRRPRILRFARGYMVGGSHVSACTSNHDLVHIRVPSRYCLDNTCAGHGGPGRFVCGRTLLFDVNREMEFDDDKK